jgi:hypothetical protein
MDNFIKVIIELIRALVSIEQARSASIDRFLTRSLEQQQKFMADMQAQMKAMAARGGMGSPEYARLAARYKEAQGQIKTLEARVKELESTYKVAVSAADRTRTLRVEWTDSDRTAGRRPRVCVRRRFADTGAVINLSAPNVAASVQADIQVLRSSGIPLSPAPVVVAASADVATPNRTSVPTTVFQVGSIDARVTQTTSTNVVNSPGAVVNTSSTAAVASSETGPTFRPVTPDVAPTPGRVVFRPAPAPGNADAPNT